MAIRVKSSSAAEHDSDVSIRLRMEGCFCDGENLNNAEGKNTCFIKFGGSITFCLSKRRLKSCSGSQIVYADATYESSKQLNTVM